jgi:deazaflavin-dependent oxidoreductase (nitroreductase family)
MTKYDYVKTRREEVRPISKSKAAGFKRQMDLYSKLNVWVYRLSFGRLMNTAMGGYPICIVTFVGMKTGRKRRIPLIHVPDGENEILVGSQAGLDRDPVWTRSVRANPEVSITFAGHSRRFRARQIDDDEKRECWPHLCSIYPAYDEYQARTDRNIPVFRCRPVG